MGSLSATGPCPAISPPTSPPSTSRVPAVIARRPVDTFGRGSRGCAWGVERSTCNRRGDGGRNGGPLRHSTKPHRAVRGRSTCHEPRRVRQTHGGVSCPANVRIIRVHFFGAVHHRVPVHARVDSVGVSADRSVGINSMTTTAANEPDETVEQERRRLLNQRSIRATLRMLSRRIEVEKDNAKVSILLARKEQVLKDWKHS